MDKIRKLFWNEVGIFNKNIPDQNGKIEFELV